MGTFAPILRDEKDLGLLEPGGSETGFHDEGLVGRVPMMDVLQVVIKQLFWRVQ